MTTDFNQIYEPYKLTISKESKMTIVGNLHTMILTSYFQIFLPIRCSACQFGSIMIFADKIIDLYRIAINMA
jgi:hypothetical protein